MVYLHHRAITTLLHHRSGPVWQMMEMYAESIWQVAHRIVPVKTGRLKRSLRWTVYAGPAGPTARVATPVPYGITVELGDPDNLFYPRQPYLEPALRQIMQGGFATGIRLDPRQGGEDQ